MHLARLAKSIQARQQSGAACRGRSGLCRANDSTRCRTRQGRHWRPGERRWPGLGLDLDQVRVRRATRFATGFGAWRFLLGHDDRVLVVGRHSSWTATGPAGVAPGWPCEDLDDFGLANRETASVSCFFFDRAHPTGGARSCGAVTGTDIIPIPPPMPPPIPPPMPPPIPPPIRRPYHRPCRRPYRPSCRRHPCRRRP